jgi:hypothetical protein
MIKGEKWVMGGKELRHLFFLGKKLWINAINETNLSKLH